ncbi:MAG: hypothetical protein M1817_003072 [Caeruleum heppii]|nr:MAG: hypothetical protein M1817_003072 [Caeruleum heppii]
MAALCENERFSFTPVRSRPVPRHQWDKVLAASKAAKNKGRKIWVTRRSTGEGKKTGRECVYAHQVNQETGEVVVKKRRLEEVLEQGEMRWAKPINWADEEPVETPGGAEGSPPTRADSPLKRKGYVEGDDIETPTMLLNSPLRKFRELPFNKAAAGSARISTDSPFKRLMKTRLEASIETPSKKPVQSPTEVMAEEPMTTPSKCQVESPSRMTAEEPIETPSKDNDSSSTAKLDQSTHAISKTSDSPLSAMTEKSPPRSVKTSPPRTTEDPSKHYEDDTNTIKDFVYKANKKKAELAAAAARARPATPRIDRRRPLSELMADSSALQRRTPRPSARKGSTSILKRYRPDTDEEDSSDSPPKKGLATLSKEDLRIASLVRRKTMREAGLPLPPRIMQAEEEVESAPPHTRKATLTADVDDAPPLTRKAILTTDLENAPPLTRKATLTADLDDAPPLTRKAVLTTDSESAPPHTRKVTLTADIDSSSPLTRRITSTTDLVNAPPLTRTAISTTDSESAPPHTRKVLESASQKKRKVTLTTDLESAPPLTRKATLTADVESASPQTRKVTSTAHLESASPKKRKATLTADLESASPKKRKGTLTADLENASPKKRKASTQGDEMESAPPKKQKIIKQKDDTAGHEATEVATCRRSTRIRLPAKSRAAQAPPSQIPLRRPDGPESMVLQRSAAQELTSLTRLNTKKNKARCQEQVETPRRVTRSQTRKAVTWDQPLEYYKSPEKESKASKPLAQLAGMGNGTPAPKRKR